MLHGVKLPLRALWSSLVLVAVASVASCIAGTEDVGSTESDLVVCGKTTVKGIDVYHGDNGGKPIDWASVKSAGISFAFAKATESTNFTDSTFATNWAGMKSAGLVRGAYHFFHSDVDPVAQAKFFLATVGAVSKGDLLVLDLETTNGQTQTVISSRAATFLATVKSATGVLPLLYTSPAFLSSFAAFSSYPLWIANYGVSCPNVPTAWTTYAFWQSTGSGSLPVISGGLDLDTFNGSLAQLEALGNPPEVDGGTPDASGPKDGGAADSSPGLDGGPGLDGSPGTDSGAADVQQDGGCAMSPGGSRKANRGALMVAVGALLLGLRRRRAPAPPRTS